MPTNSSNQIKCIILKNYPRSPARIIKNVNLTSLHNDCLYLSKCFDVVELKWYMHDNSRKTKQQMTTTLLCVYSTINIKLHHRYHPHNRSPTSLTTCTTQFTRATSAASIQNDIGPSTMVLGEISGDAVPMMPTITLTPSKRDQEFSIPEFRESITLVLTKHKQRKAKLAKNYIPCTLLNSTNKTRKECTHQIFTWKRTSPS